MAVIHAWVAVHNSACEGEVVRDPEQGGWYCTAGCAYGLLEVAAPFAGAQAGELLKAVIARARRGVLEEALRQVKAGNRGNSYLDG